MMVGRDFDTQFLRQHGPLVQRADAIVGSLFDVVNIDLRDAKDTGAARPRSRTIRLERGSVPALGRSGSAITSMTYADPLGEAALAMLLAAMAGPEDPIAADPQSLSVFALAERLAASDIPVLINGPTGTGKEVLSRYIHAHSNRADRPFIAVNCAAMPETMLEAMLFGHQKGAFTGATSASEGFMRAANGGTLLLDEIAEMPLPLQAKLLRALQEQEVVPIGSSKPIKIDARVIACANRDLPTEVAEGRFRADLYYRLNVFPLQLASLRERADDIAPLAFAMALRHAPDPTRVPCLNDGALALLKQHSWPGNVRELENVMRRALLLAHGETLITARHIVFDSPARLIRPPYPSTVPGFGQSFASPLPAASAELAYVDETAENDMGRKLSSIVQLSEARAIMETLEACGGSRVRTARELGISERTLRYRLASLREAGIEIGLSAAGGRR